jgi:arsenate reductase
VVRAMKEKDIEMRDTKPKILTSAMIEDADLVVTMGCSVEKVCPAPTIARMQKKLLDWRLEDPKGKPLEVVRQIRDEIERKVAELVDKNP